MSKTTTHMEIIKVTLLRCPICGYERRLQGVYDPKYLDLNCPACLEPDKYAGWAAGAGAEPVRFDTPPVGGSAS